MDLGAFVGALEPELEISEDGGFVGVGRVVVKGGLEF
jgi:hypothetical protein